MESEVDVLIVSSRIENKRTLLHPRRSTRKHILSLNGFSSAGISRHASTGHCVLRRAASRRFLSRTAYFAAQLAANESIHRRAVYG